MAFKAKYRFLKAHRQPRCMYALRTAKTNPANFVLHEITDSCERLFQGFGIGSNGSGHPFEKRLSSVRTALAIRLKKECHPWNDSGYPFQENCHPFNQIERLELSIGKRNVIPSNDSGYPFEKNCHRFERVELSVSRATVPNHFHPGRLRRICQKIMQAL